jgi:hypothetical protein
LPRAKPDDERDEEEDEEENEDGDDEEDEKAEEEDEDEDVDEEGEDGDEEEPPLLAPPVQSGDFLGLPFSSTGRPGVAEFCDEGVPPCEAGSPEEFIGLPGAVEVPPGADESTKANPPFDEVANPSPDWPPWLGLAEPNPPP